MINTIQLTPLFKTLLLLTTTGTGQPHQTNKSLKDLLTTFSVTLASPAQMTPILQPGNTFGLVEHHLHKHIIVPQLLLHQPSGPAPPANMVCKLLLQVKRRKLSSTSGTKWPGIRSETQESTSDCSTHQEELHPPGLSADMLQLLPQTLEFQTSSCSLTSPREHQSATPQKLSRWPNPVTSYLSSVSNGLIS